MPRRSGKSSRPRRKVPTESYQDADNFSDSDSVELPGFFYDPEKKRYFKWSPEIRERAKALKAAKQRKQQDVVYKRNGSALFKHRNIETLVRDRSSGCGPTTTQAFISTLRSTMVTSLKCPGGDRTLALHHPDDEVQQLHVIGSYNSNQELSAIGAVTRRNMASYSFQVSCRTPVGLGNFEPFHDSFSLEGQVMQSVLMLPEQSSSSSNSSTAAAASVGTLPHLAALAYTTTSFDMRSKLYVQPLPSDWYTGIRPEPTSYALGRGASRGCAYEASSRRIAVGLEKNLVVCSYQGHLEQIRRISYSSDVRAVDFCPRDEGVMYVCTWAGQMHRQDLREPPLASTCLDVLQKISLDGKQDDLFCMQGRVGCIRPLRNLPHVIISYTDGQIALWDVRSKKVVCHYKGSPGKYNRAVPFHLDESEQFICAGGFDGTVHIWDVACGGSPLAKLLLPCPACESPPVVAISTVLGEPVVLAGECNRISAFTYRGNC